MTKRIATDASAEGKGGTQVNILEKSNCFPLNWEKTDDLVTQNIRQIVLNSSTPYNCPALSPIHLI